MVFLFVFLSKFLQGNSRPVCAFDAATSGRRYGSVQELLDFGNSCTDVNAEVNTLPCTLFLLLRGLSKWHAKIH